MGGGPRRELAENEKRYSELSAGIRIHTGQNIVTGSPDRQRASGHCIMKRGSDFVDVHGSLSITPRALKFTVLLCNS